MACNKIIFGLHLRAFLSPRPILPHNNTSAKNRFSALRRTILYRCPACFVPPPLSRPQRFLYPRQMRASLRNIFGNIFGAKSLSKKSGKIFARTCDKLGKAKAKKVYLARRLGKKWARFAFLRTKRLLQDRHPLLYFGQRQTNRSYHEERSVSAISRTDARAKKVWSPMQAAAERNAARARFHIAPFSVISYLVNILSFFDML